MCRNIITYFCCKDYIFPCKHMYKRCTFYASSGHSSFQVNPIISRMYKKLHNKETLPSWKPLYAKGFLFPCVPERDIMLTTFVYRIQLKNRKNYCLPQSSFFSRLIAMYKPKSIGRARRLLNIIVCKVMKSVWTGAQFI
jgi:hypothetical protein